MPDQLQARANLVNMILRGAGFDAQAVGGAGLDALAPNARQNFGADGGTPLAAAQWSQMRIVLQVLEGDTLDQDVLSEADLSDTVLPAQILSPDLPSYLRMLRYMQANPSLLQSIQVVSSEPNNQAPQLNSMGVTPTRVTPFNSSSTNTLFVSSYISGDTFNQNRVSVALNERLDTISFLNFQTDVPADSNTTFTLTLFIGARAEGRNALPTDAPNVLLGQNGVMQRLPAAASPVGVRMQLNPALLAQLLPAGR